MAIKPRLGRDTEGKEINSGRRTRLFGCPPGRYLSGLEGFLLFPCLLCDAGERAPVEPSKLTPFFESLLWGPDSGLDLRYRNPTHTYIENAIPSFSFHPRMHNSCSSFHGVRKHTWYTCLLERSTIFVFVLQSLFSYKQNRLLSHTS